MAPPFESRKAFLEVALLAIFLGFRTPSSIAQSTTTASLEHGGDEEQACEINLNLIFDAIREYRSAHSGGLPARLSDLVPEFIADPKTLICPVERRTWSQRSWNRSGIWDPGFEPHASYSYEFNQTELPDILWRGLPKRTCREFKQAQMAQLERKGQPGGEVPIARCHRHKLNLGFSGSVYSTKDIYWERKFAKSDKDLEDLLVPGRLFADRTEPRSLTTGDFESRDSKATPRFLDLTAYYNAQLTDGWQGFPGNDLSSMPRGLQQFNREPFDVRGIIQLGGEEAAVIFPNRIDSIAVHQRFSRIHLLHAATFPPIPPRQMKLASYVLHYVNGQTNEIPVVYGQNIADWWFDPKDDPQGLSVPKNALIAWEGENQAVKVYGKLLRIYQMSWDNPLPDIEVVSISLVSLMELPAPFVIAITVEP
jgi:hypothetical protein